MPLAGAVLVVAVLLLLSTDAELRWLWSADRARGGRLDGDGGVADPALGLLSGATDCRAWNCPPPCTSPTDDGYVATALTIGPWDPGLQHAGPPAALLLREAERASGIDGGQTVRMAYDIFAPVPVGPVARARRPSSGPAAGSSSSRPCSPAPTSGR